MLRDPRLLENWRTSVLEPLRPAVFMSVNTQWTAAAWVQMQAARAETRPTQFSPSANAVGR